MEKRENRLINLIDELGSILLANTELTDEEIQEAAFNEDYDAEGMDYEMKLDAKANELNIGFERVYAETVVV